MYKKQGDFELEIEAGTFHNSQIVVMLGENGTGKTTFIKMLAGRSKEEAKCQLQTTDYRTKISGDSEIAFN
jgi:ATP-binding cassette subfamily E protein 1